MAEPIVIVKEGSLTVEVWERPDGSTSKGKRVLRVTIPGDFEFPSGSVPKGKKGVGGKSWVITWKKPPSRRRRR